MFGFFLHNVSLPFIVHEIVAEVKPPLLCVPEMTRPHPSCCAGLTTSLRHIRALGADEQPRLAGAKRRLLLQTSHSVSFTFKTKLLHSSLARTADLSPC